MPPSPGSPSPAASEPVGPAGSPLAVVEAAHATVSSMLGLCNQIELRLYTAAAGAPTPDYDGCVANWRQLLELVGSLEAAVNSAGLYLNVGNGAVEFGATVWPNYHAAAANRLLLFASSVLNAGPPAFLDVSLRLWMPDLCENLERPAGVTDDDPPDRVLADGFRDRAREIHSVIQRNTDPMGRTRLRTLVGTEYRDAVARLQPVPLVVPARGGRPRDERLDRVMARCAELRAQGQPVKEIRRIVNAEFEADFEYATIQSYCKPSRRRKRG